MIETIEEHRHFGGTTGYYRHDSSACSAPMRFAVYVPPQARERRVPVMYFLSGLTCTEENFMVKAGAQRFAAEYGLLLVAPDTSPRNTGISGEDDDSDLGSGAGFYVDATVAPWSKHYRMFSYVTEELPALIGEHFSADGSRQGICGHSMGGHGALICALKKPAAYRSVSALAPITAPMQVPWGQKAFNAYLGDNRDGWRAYDASDLVRHAQYPDTILIDQGAADPFLDTQLKPKAFTAASKAAGQRLALNLRDGYDHSYYFISTFIEDHIRHHAERLGCQGAG